MSEAISGARSDYPFLPLRGVVLFPHAAVPLEVGRERSVRAVEQAVADEGYIVLATQKDPKVDVPSVDEVYQVGVLAVVKKSVRMPSGQLKVVVEATRRVRIDSISDNEAHFTAQVTPLTPSGVVRDPAKRRALVQATLRELEKYITVGKRLSSEVLVTLAGVEEIDRLGDLISMHLPVSVPKRQELLELVEPEERLEHICVLIGEELEIAQIQERVQARVRAQMEKNQKEYYLREQMKAIQKELGEDDERAAEVNEYRERMETAKLPKAAKERVEHELKRLERMPQASAEGVVVRTYLDWLLSLPWSKRSRDRTDIERARQVLDADHYGLEKVKERILEFLAVRKMADKLRGPILCLVGPPGVGKTSLAKSVARALERKFVRLSLGGVRDEAEIRGHRRTYIGAMPGKILQAMRQAGTRNPVLLLDEVDKMSGDFRGDPSSALLEVLDPEQNHTFADHYIEIPFDLSDVFFITTANVLAAIPGPLRDRMEVIELSGYTEEEKVGIARHHVVPKQLKMHGLTEEHLSISEAAIREMIRGYTREAGVRQLERNVGKVCRKVALEVVEGSERPAQITARNIERYLGVPLYRHNLAEVQDQVGTATGLAYTQVGGDILPIEVTVLQGKGSLTLTGKLGEVMRESAQAAFTYVRSRYAQLGLDPGFHETCDIHVHVPEGAIPKDGPSAGVAIAVALASALTGRPVARDVAMTGEITLRGRILPIGGVKEKVLAAHRAGIKRVVLPKENRRHLEEVPVSVRKSMAFHLVEHMDEALFHAIRAPEGVLEETAAAQDAPVFTADDEPTRPWAEPNPQ